MAKVGQSVDLNLLADRGGTSQNNQVCTVTSRNMQKDDKRPVSRQIGPQLDTPSYGAHLTKSTCTSFVRGRNNPCGGPTALAG